MVKVLIDGLPKLLRDASGDFDHVPPSVISDALNITPTYELVLHADPPEAAFDAQLAHILAGVPGGAVKKEDLPPLVTMANNAATAALDKVCGAPPLARVCSRAGACISACHAV